MIKSMSDSLYDKIASSVGAEKEALEEFVGVLHSIRESPPSCLKNVLGIFISEKFSDLLSGGSDDTPIDFNKFSVLVDHFQAELSQDKNETPSFFVEMMREPAYQSKAQDFLLKNMNRFADSGRYIVVNNIINFLKFIDPLGIQLDLWECQNIFYDIWTESDWKSKDNIQLRPALLELGLLLGFLIEEK
jgi:hypothetical protein